MAKLAFEKSIFSRTQKANARTEGIMILEYLRNISKCVDFGELSFIIINVGLGLVFFQDFRDYMILSFTILLIYS